MAKVTDLTKVASADSDATLDVTSEFRQTVSGSAKVLEVSESRLN
jgi:hypothetical protein